MKIYDISRVLSSELAPWPGDTTFQYELAATIAGGYSVNVGRVTASIHTGSHVDAFYHFDDAGKKLEALELERYLGPALVVDVTAKCGRDPAAVISVTDLEPFVARNVARLLLRTGGWPDSNRFPASIPVMAPDVPEYLRETGVRLLGLDVPSVDAIDSKDLKNHHALAAADVAILEGLDLSGIEAGEYMLSALPLRIAGADGSPVRAVLWRD